jgi:hypothetical protein
MSDEAGALAYGAPQQADIQLMRETYPGELNVAFTRGFVSSQAFADEYQKFGPIAEYADGCRTSPPKN